MKGTIMKRLTFKSKFALAFLGTSLAFALIPAMAMAEPAQISESGITSEINVSGEVSTPVSPSATSTSDESTSPATTKSEIAAGYIPTTPEAPASTPVTSDDDAIVLSEEGEGTPMSPASEEDDDDSSAADDIVNDGANDASEGGITTQDDENPATAGTCGDGVTWSYAGGVLSIDNDGTGTGAMSEVYGSGAPWAAYLTEITSLSIAEGVTRIGSYAFMDMTALQSVYIPNSVQSIGILAFGGCTSLRSVQFGNGSSYLQTIETSAFINTSLESLYLPDSVTSIAGEAFVDLGTLQFVEFGTSHSNLQTIHGFAFGEADTTGVISSVIYHGTQSEWNAINLTESGNTRLTNANIQFANQTYTISFDANGGVVYPESLETMSDTRLQYLPTPTRSGYSFDGWFDAHEGGNEITASTKFASDTTVYAQWSFVGYPIVFDTNGGSFVGGLTSTTYYTDVNGNVMFPADPTFGDNTFNGWFDARTDGTQYYSTSTLGSAMTLYAQWTYAQGGGYTGPFTITFDVNASGATLNDSNIMETDSNGYLSSLPNNPEFAGHIFRYWRTEPNGGKEVTLGLQFTDNATVYAYWETDYTQIVTHTVYFFEDTYVTYSYTSLKTDATYSTIPYLPTPNRDGFTFVGWFTAAGEHVTLDRQYTEDTNLYGRWTEIPVITYTVTFNANGGAFADGTLFQDVETDSNGMASAPARPIWEGNTYQGWFTDPIAGDEFDAYKVFTGNAIYYAHWENNTTGEDPEPVVPTAPFTITFNANGGALDGEEVFTRTTGEDGTLPTPVDATPVREGYKFLGWFTDQEEDEPVSTSTVFAGDATVYARWELDTAGTDDPGTDDPGTDDPGTDDPGNDDPGTEDPGNDTPDIPNTPDTPNTPTDPDPIVYEILDDGDNQIWAAEDDAELVIRASGEFANFDHIKVDGEMVDVQHYNVREGSTIVTLSHVFLSTLPEGVHNLTFVYKDGGVANANFSIAPKPAVYEPGVTDAEPVQADVDTATAVETVADGPAKTSDSSSLILYAIALLCAIVGLAGMRAARRVRR